MTSYMYMYIMYGLRIYFRTVGPEKKNLVIYNILSFLKYVCFVVFKWDI